ncbi:TetR/AcrR family transcriptional regulator [Nonomuraea deserti]|uniref:TetR/AcrR family transcriptional regulator n=2 Tax=Nonomuraea deserti TaxID=1848322 RepID=A0A4R4VEA2_9ACTN|nr:TetR/AcrR family transcriptional regulator [Nonomuraea deserti]
MRGLTHRAVDEAAGLPPGSTSNLARTRAALLELTLSRLTELEMRALGPAYTSTQAGAQAGAQAGTKAGAQVGTQAGDQVDSQASMVDRVAEGLHIQINDRRRTLARYELALEATRRPELREIYDAAGSRFRDPAVALLAAQGSRDPVRHARQLVAFSEGLMFDAIVGAGGTPTFEELRQAVEDFLAGMLRRPSRGP